MSKVPIERLLLNGLAGTLKNISQDNITGPPQMTKEDAYKMLKSLTNQDFGYDVNVWKNWLKKHRIKPTNQMPEM